MGGDGVGKISAADANNGKKAFVSYALAGEVVDARRESDHRNFSRWIPNKITQPSPERINPPCSVHFRPGMKIPHCGGCQWQHMALQEQRRWKERITRETLERLGKISHIPMKPILTLPIEWRYRNKVQIPFGRQNGKLTGGFFSPGTHRVVPFDDCLIQPEISNKIFKSVIKLAEMGRWKPYEEDPHRGWIRHLLIRTNSEGEALIILVTRTAEFPDKKSFLSVIHEEHPQVVGVFQNIQPARTNVILGRKWLHLAGRKYLDETILGLKFSFSPASFMQVNTEAATLLYKKAIDELSIENHSLVVDLYCGVGVMALLAARNASMAIGVEEHPAAIADAQWNAEQNKISNVEFHATSAENWIRSSSFERLLMDDPHRLRLIVDPPRSGCDPQVIEAILKLKPGRVVYVSCNPATLARDLNLLQTRYQLDSVTPVDLFPQTSHIECVATLIKK